GFLLGRAAPNLELPYDPLMPGVAPDASLQAAVDVALLIELGGNRAAILLRQRDVALQLDGDRHRDLAQANSSAEHARQRTGLAVVVEQFQGQAVLARAAGQLQTERLDGGRAQDCNFRAFHASSRGDRYKTRPLSSSPSIRAQTRRQAETSPGTPKST